MKTYAELELEAYLAGNTEMAKAYAAADDAAGDDIESLRDQLRDAQNKLDEISNIAGC
jgi:hypothetical protein